MRILTATLSLFLGAPLLAADRPIDFNRDVRPILSDKCFHCHGPDEHTREAELRLDVEADAKKSRDGLKAIEPGRPEASELVRRITSAGDDRMPPPGSTSSSPPGKSKS